MGSADPRGFQTFTYIDNPSWFCISFDGQFIRLPDACMINLIASIEHYKKTRVQREKDRLDWLRNADRLREDNKRDQIED